MVPVLDASQCKPYSKTHIVINTIYTLILLVVMQKNEKGIVYELKSKITFGGRHYIFQLQNSYKERRMCGRSVVVYPKSSCNTEERVLYGEQEVYSERGKLESRKKFKNG